MSARSLPFIALLLAPLCALGQPTAPLNDTGITWSSAGIGENAASCDPGHPAGQDCHYGRDTVGGRLSKVGGSTPNNGMANGFDFTKVCNSGERAGEGGCPENPALGDGENQWACTKDNITGLIWEVKVNSASHLRHKNHTYTWYDSVSPDGSPGALGTRVRHFLDLFGPLRLGGVI